METIIKFNPKARQYSPQDLAAICECAKAGFSLEDTAIVMQVSYDDFLNDYNNADSAVRKSYDLGYLQSRMLLNQRINTLAQNGSAAAQSEMRKILAEQEIRNFMKTLDM